MSVTETSGASVRARTESATVRYARDVADDGATTAERLGAGPTTAERIGGTAARTEEDGGGYTGPDYPWNPGGVANGGSPAPEPGGYTGPDYPWNPGGVANGGSPAPEPGGYTGPDYPWNPGGVANGGTVAPLDPTTPTVPVNTDWQVDTDGFVANDPRIVRERVPELERTPFADPVGDIENVVLHRTVTRTAEDTLDVFRTPTDEGYYFGTHFLVGRDGTIYQTASLNNRTNHVVGHNTSSVGIEVVGMPLDPDGNVTVTQPIAGWEPLTPEQAESVAYLTNSLTDYYDLDRADVAVHEDLQAKTEGEGRTVLDAIEPMLAD